MKKYFPKKILIMTLLAIVIFVSIPKEAQARNLFRQFFHDLKRGVQFIVKLPDRITKPLGPVLGPIASALLTQNIAGHHKFGNLFRGAHRVNNAINDIEEQKRLTGEVKQMYRDQASQLRNYVTQLQAAREKLKQQLIDRNISMSDYVKTAIDLDKMIDTVDTTAERFDRNANRINTGHIIKMAANSLLESVVGEIKNAAIGEISDEIFSVINPNVIDILINQESRGLDGFLDLLIGSTVDETDGKFDLDQLRDKIKDRIREILEENKDAFKDNLKDKINEVIQEIMDETKGITEENKEDMSVVGEAIAEVQREEKISSYGDDELATTLTEIAKDEFGCRAGYVWQRMSGVGCVQKDCGDAGGHYSYTKDCICGFVNPKPGALTKSCLRPSNFIACPSCLYTCVTPDSDCPER